jgi:hypothetical protein
MIEGAVRMSSFNPECYDGVFNAPISVTQYIIYKIKV